MDHVTALERTFDHTAKIVAGVTAEQLGAPTPCQEWDLGQLLAHTLGVVHGIGSGVRGEELADMNAFVLADDLDAQFREESQRTLAAWKATDPSAVVNIGAGDMPAAIAIQINLLDTAMHSWDIAQASGQDGELSPDLAEVVLGACTVIVSDEIRAVAGFAPAQPVAADATATRRLAAFLGRSI